MSDNAMTYRIVVKEIAHLHGVYATFMPKPLFGENGSGMHTHQSLFNDGRNAFYDEGGHYHLSDIGRAYIAGLLKHAREICALFAPNVNSYKRLVDGYWSPTKPTWGVDNRTCAYRVIPGNEKSTRLEVRVGGADINPYLAIAAALASGLYGIEKKLELTDKPITGSAYQESAIPRLPRNLSEATDRLTASPLARELFGDAFVDHFVRTRRWEWGQYQDAVTDWEMKRYFEII
jgi:glutamine synthetase